MEWRTLFFLIFSLHHCVKAAVLPSSVSFISDVNFSLDALVRQGSQSNSSPRDFKHPGLLYTHEDFLRIKLRKQHGGWVAQRAYQQFVTDDYSKPDHVLIGPYETVTLEFVQNYEPTANAFRFDSQAARQLALLWAIDGNEQAGRTAIKILDTWAKSLKQFKGMAFMICFSSKYDSRTSTDSGDLTGNIERRKWFATHRIFSREHFDSGSRDHAIYK